MKEGAIDCERAIVTHHQATEVAEPGVSAFDDPTPLVTSQGATILRRRFLPVRAMRDNQFDASSCQPLTQRITVVGLVGDHPHGLLSRPTRTMTPTYADRRKRGFREPDFRRGCRVKVVSQRKTAVVDPRAATTAILARFREQGRDFLPLRFGQQRTRPRHRPSLGAADSPYRSFRKTQPSFFQTLVLGYATASTNVSNKSGNLLFAQR